MTFTPPSEETPSAAVALALRHNITGGPPEMLKGLQALPVLENWLEDVRSYCADASFDDARVSDWLLDNDYVILRALRRLKVDMPPDFYRLLPALAIANHPPVPRIFDIAETAYDTLLPELSRAELIKFTHDYQAHNSLTNAELWAFPTMLRLVCIERLVAVFARFDPDLAPAVLLDHDEYGKDDSERPVEQIARAIGNLHALDSIKWADFVDEVSRIEAELTKDPARVYAGMTFETRDQYRTEVEKLARRCDLSEPEVAIAAVGLCKDATAGSSAAHVGYWLIGSGRPTLEAEVHARGSIKLALYRRLRAHRGKLYGTALVAACIAALAVPMTYLFWLGATPFQWMFGTVISLLPATVLSVWLVHWLIAQATRPKPLPEMDFSKRIPATCATAVVLPVIVGSETEAHGLIDQLEVLALANPDPALRFVVLSDPVDADSERIPADAPVEQALSERIERLNQHLAEGDIPRFLLLHRRRIYNPAEGCWMAWERKRGKLEDFNRLVLGEGENPFALTVGPLDDLSDIRFAITLDADTQVPPGAANRLIGIMAHPLNKAIQNPQTGRVESGYAILQPRIDILPKQGRHTHFSHLYSGDTAIDIYSRAVSDVYQDLFETGIFVGKGIYDIAALQTAMQGRVPDNHILSHDLFEGLHGRAALASNLVLYEDLPPTYPEFAMRQHRWMRGDWQLLPWLRGTVPVADGQKARTILQPLDRWKMVDNLRRSLVPPALLIFILGAWLVLPGSAIVWTLLAVAAPGSYLVGEFFSIATGGIRRGWLGAAVHKLKSSGGRWFCSIVFLVSDTLIALDAVFRTLWRSVISKKRRLEWTSAAHAAADMSHLGIRTVSWRLMWPSSALALVLGGHLALYNPAGFWPALPVLVLWLLAPEISVWSARPRFFRDETLEDDQRHFLRLVARRTWHFFETFVGPDDNWLPPDNYQHGSVEEIAHRTSPTNIGMFLVSALAARELGFITTSDFLARSRNTLDALDRVETYRGHILNWYDTRSLQPLEPRYVSTVDSGNLAVALIVLKQGCLELAGKPTMDRACFGCLDTTLDLLVSALRELPEHDAKAVDRIESDIRAQLRRSASPVNWLDSLGVLNAELWHRLEALVRDTMEAVPVMTEEQETEIMVWLDRFQHDLHAIARDIDTFAPWVHVLRDAPPELVENGRQIADLLTAEPEAEAPDAIGEALALVDALTGEASGGQSAWLEEMRIAISNAKAAQADLRRDLSDLAARADKLAYAMDFSFLYDPSVRLFYIGYNQSLGQMDKSHYDLLATEARLASYFAIAKHDVPIEHWFSFSRPITRLEGKPSILSWNGSMFEYLMPPLFLRGYRDTLLGESELTAIDFQRAYAAERGVPWGISESAFAATDSQGTYQYRAFGVPGLGIRRGLSDDLVVAPYSTALALCGLPDAASRNLKEIAALGAMTRYGYFDALDFTPTRRPADHDFVPVQTYMAHHQGMILAAIANATLNDVMVRRFMADRHARAMELLLQECVPWDALLEQGRADERWERPDSGDAAPGLAPWVPSTDLQVPQVHVLGNGRMSSLMTDSGGGGLAWRQNALTRWVADPTRTAQGVWLYIQDRDSRDLWSLGEAPTGGDPEETRCVFHQHMVEFLRRRNGIVARMDVTVPPFDDVEIRRITLLNESDRTRTLDLTTYGEVVLAPPLEDERHPAFSKLFVHSRFLPEHAALIFERRPRRPETRPPVMLHKLVCSDPDVRVTGWDTDRAHFIGRHGSAGAPLGLQEGELSATDGWTLDPVMALQTRVRLKPMESRELTFLTVAGRSHSGVVEIAGRFTAPAIERAFREALTEAAREVQRLQIDPARLPELQVLSSLLTHASQSLRRPPPQDDDAWQGQPDLWRFGISGDLPILLLEATAHEAPPFLDLLVRAQRLWHHRGLQVDLVILRDAVSGYEEPLREQVQSILRDMQSEGVIGMRGGIHLLHTDQLGAGLKRGLTACAHVVLNNTHKNLNEALDRALEDHLRPPVLMSEPAMPYAEVPPLQRPEGLQFDNGYGGFDPQGGDYLIHMEPGHRTPAPWCNVVANETFGCLVSEAGLGMTWAVNSGEHRLTPWSNDPVSDRPGEVLYLRDEATGDLWTPTPLPLGKEAACQVRHGAGHSQWLQNSHGLEQRMDVFVPDDAPVKLVRLHLRNRSGQRRRLSATYYTELLLGAVGSVARPHVDCCYDSQIGAIVVRNRWNPEFAARAAFLTASSDAHSVTGDRHDFLGREHDITNPEGLRRWDLGGRFTVGGDSCAAYQVRIDLAADASTEVVFALGETDTADGLASTVARWRKPREAACAFAAVTQNWADRLGAVQVSTPDAALDVMVNRWLPYQNRACRIMARAGFYQAGGAYGFRDQLQDMLALLHSDPARVRSHIILAAQHQFEQGDVLHWWHPPAGRGVRTRCSDDYIWLVFVSARYIEATADTAILEEQIPFLSAPELGSEETDRYALFERGAVGSLYDHCARALDRMMGTGPHGLPLMGAGDWNDGMDRIGDKGRGESIWLAWFQIATVARFAPIAARAGHPQDAERWQRHAERVRAAVAENGWDGAWYLRAFDDEGVAWGSHENEECRIDLIAQAWSALTGSPPDDRTGCALRSAAQQLVDKDARLIRLLTPPFDQTDRDPGYIQAYPPGIRENGGQYTHAAAWLGAAFVAVRNGDRAYEVFDLINPVKRSADHDVADHYQREPYVLTGDVSGAGDRIGHGGWSWYTGSAGWTWQLAVAGILGVQPVAGEIRIDPCLPKSWGRAAVTLNGAAGTLEITIEDPGRIGAGQNRLTVDGARWSSDTVAFPGKGRVRRVNVQIVPPAALPHENAVSEPSSVLEDAPEPNQPDG